MNEENHMIMPFADDDLPEEAPVIESLYKIATPVLKLSLSTRIEGVLAGFDNDEFDIDEAIDVLKEALIHARAEKAIADSLRRLSESAEECTNRVRSMWGQGNQA